MDTPKGLLKKALSKLIPATSLRTMNNIAVSGYDEQGKYWTFYEISVFKILYDHESHLLRYSKSQKIPHLKKRSPPSESPFS